MERFLYRAVFGYLTATLLAACAGALPAQRHQQFVSSWMAPEASKGQLLYVADGATGDVFIFSYPRGKLVGTLSGFAFPSGLCVDRRGNVFVTQALGPEIFEYAPGALKPTKTLHDVTNSFANACAVDPTTGDLAVANNGSGKGLGRGQIAIFRKAKGSPKLFRAVYHPYNCAYDAHGNLFIDGATNGFQAFSFGELPKGDATFVRISLGRSFELAGGVMWRGTRIAVGDVFRSVIYEFTIQRGHATQVGVTSLGGSQAVWSFWIAGESVIAPSADAQSAGASTVLVYHYPAGGEPTQTIGSGIVRDPVGVVLTRR